MLLFAGLMSMLAVGATVFMGGEDGAASQPDEDEPGGTDAGTPETTMPETAMDVGELMDDPATEPQTAESEEVATEASVTDQTGDETQAAVDMSEQTDKVPELDGGMTDQADAGAKAAASADDGWITVSDDETDSGGGQIEGNSGKDSQPDATGGDMLHGQDSHDQLQGGAGADEIHGLGGNDSLSGKAGDDSLFGGPGDDTLEGGEGEDCLDSAFGANNMAGGPGQDTLFGGTGDDTLVGNDDDESDFLDAGAGDDMILAGPGDAVEWGQGADTIAIEAGIAEEVEIMYFQTGMDKLEIRYDAADGVPEFEVQQHKLDDDQYRVLIDGASVASIHAAGFGAKDIVLVAQDGL